MIVPPRHVVISHREVQKYFQTLGTRQGSTAEVWKVFYGKNTRRMIRVA